ncbi:MAG: DUF4115 domain-containing protein [Burkholderiaceae bacterium]|nr:DUF4115 domain-containing protein [Burkholderiaceae bacterium]
MQVGTPEELAAAREARGMSQVDISQRIKLQVKQVKALEEGDWDALPGRSFVRGALRSYGKLIDVDVGPLLESVGGFAEPTQVEGITPLDAPISRSSGLGFNGGGRGSPILWVIAGLIGVIALVLYFGSDRDGSGAGSWLRPGTQAPADAGDPAASQPGADPQGGANAPARGVDSPSSQAPSSETPSNGPSAAAEAIGSSTALTVSSDPAPSSPAGSGQSNGAASPIGTAPAKSAAPANGVAPTDGAVSSAGAAPANGSTPSQAPASLPQPLSMEAPPPAWSPPVAPAQTAGVGGQASAAPGAEDLVTASPAPVASPSAGSDGAVATSETASLASARASDGESAARGSDAEPPATVDTKGLIRLQAGSQDSWIEVRQSDGTALHNGLVKAGESIELKGTPPYRLVLGNASHVSLTYEGKARDLGPHMRANNIARLQLR